MGLKPRRKGAQKPRARRRWTNVRAWLFRCNAISALFDRSIYLTAYADGETLRRARVTTPFGYIIKPFEDRELQTTIEMAVYKFEIDARLVRSEKLLATTLHSLGEAVVTSDANGLVRFLNPVAERILGRSLGDAQGKPLADIVHIASASARPDKPALIEPLGLHRS